MIKLLRNLFSFGVIVLSIVAIFTLAWLVIDFSSDRHEADSSHLHENPEAVTSKESIESSKHLIQSERTGSYSVSGIEITSNIAEKYLAAAANKSAALAALYEYTKDPAYLASLKERVLLDPQAGLLLAILTFYNDNSDDRTRASNRIAELRKARSAFPTDAMLTACLAGTEAAIGNHDEALALLREINNPSGMKEGLIGRQNAMRDLLRAGGLSDEPKIWTFSATKEAESLFAISSMVHAISKTIRGTDGMPLDSQVEVASRVVALARSLNPYNDTAEINALVALSLEKLALQHLPPQTKFGDGGQTTFERLAEIAEAKKHGDYVRNDIQPLLENLQPSVLQNYFERREKFGAPIATEWLKEQIIAHK